ncbi:MAG: glycosyltransferase family A protein [Reichenbachiella sp.]|uniref:glycosyltransferase family 2 protein n=1 Tax=Reichenbachiella sp. TaxID=2184521 RepID=UPI00326613A3
MTDSSISIVIPCYNGAEHLGKAIQSVLDQKIDHVQIVVVDDGSTDDSPSVARSYDQVTLIQQANAGPAAARNMGVLATNSTFVGFLDADDLYPPNKLKLQMEYLTAHPELDLISGRIQCMGTHSDHMYTEMYEDQEKKTMLNFHLGASLYKRQVFEEIGLLDEELKYSEDVDHWFKIVEQGLKYAFLDQVTLLHRRHETNMTNIPLAEQNSFFIRAIKKSMDRRKKLDSFQMPDFFQHALRRKSN